MYTFKLHLTKGSSSLVLLLDNKTLDEQEWQEGRDMGRKLFEAIRDLLKTNHLKSEDINEFEVESELPDMYTSSRIAETVKRVYNFSVSAKTNRKR